MEIGSKEHRSLLYRNIWKMAFKTSLLALVIGFALMLPAQLRENAFSFGLQTLGQAIMLLGLAYSAWVAWKKHRAIQKSLAHLSQS